MTNDRLRLLLNEPPTTQIIETLRLIIELNDKVAMCLMALINQAPKYYMDPSKGQEKPDDGP